MYLQCIYFKGRSWKSRFSGGEKERPSAQNTPIIDAEITDPLKARLAKLYQDPGALDQQFQGKTATQTLEEDPALAMYLSENGFGP